MASLIAKLPPSLRYISPCFLLPSPLPFAHAPLSISLARSSISSIFLSLILSFPQSSVYRPLPYRRFFISLSLSLLASPFPNHPYSTPPLHHLALPLCSFPRLLLLLHSLPPLPLLFQPPPPPNRPHLVSSNCSSSFAHLHFPYLDIQLSSPFHPVSRSPFTHSAWPTPSSPSILSPYHSFLPTPSSLVRPPPSLTHSLQSIALLRLTYPALPRSRPLIAPA